MTALSNLFRTDSNLPRNTELDSHLLEDLGLSRLVMEYAEIFEGSTLSKHESISFSGDPAER